MLTAQQAGRHLSTHTYLKSRLDYSLDEFPDIVWLKANQLVHVLYGATLTGHVTPVVPMLLRKLLYTRRKGLEDLTRCATGRVVMMMHRVQRCRGRYELLRLQLTMAVHMYALSGNLTHTLALLLPVDMDHLEEVKQSLQLRRQDVGLVEWYLAAREGDPDTLLSCAWIVRRISTMLVYMLEGLGQHQMVEVAPDMASTAMEEDVGFVLRSLLKGMRGVAIQHKQWTPHGQAINFVVQVGGKKGQASLEVLLLWEGCPS